jgi:hypothetical protein
MTETTERPARLPYVKPFVRNLDVEDTEGKSHVFFTERTTPTFLGVVVESAPS